MVKRALLYIVCIFSLLPFQGCDMEKEIDIKLPAYPNTPVVECYLEPGKPYRLFTYYSTGYFETVNLVPVNDAIVSIRHRGEIINLVRDTIPRPGEMKRYNYRAEDLTLVPAHYNETFELNITIQGKLYQASTRIPNIVPIDLLEYNCNSEQRCQAFTRFRDPANEKNYYRYLTMADSVGGDIKQNYLVNDDLFDGGNAALGGFYSFNQGQKAVVRLFHLTKEHYDFLNSVGIAQGSNGNPFAQPANIKSNIPGLLGIFTGLSFDEDEKSNP